MDFARRAACDLIPHILFAVYGVTPALTAEFDFGNIRLELARVVEACEKHDAVAVPCHPGRPKVGMAAHIEHYGIPAGVSIVETMNGGSRGREDDVAKTMAAELGYKGIGGSDAHIVSHIGRSATRFPADVRSEGELVEALRAGEFEAVAVS